MTCGEATKGCQYNRAAMLSRRLAFVLAVVLLVAGTARIGWLVGHQPTLGYANQFDMGRTSACLGLWPDLPEPARYEAHREAPVPRYIGGERRPAECYVSSELVFAGAAVAAWKIGTLTGIATGPSMDLRYVGAIKAVALVVLAWLFTFLTRDRPAPMLMHAAVLAVILADPVVTLWMNTLYTEFAALLFGYAALVCITMLASSSPRRVGWLWTLMVALMGLGLSRQQHTLLPLCLLLLALPAIWRTRRAFVLPLFCAACVAAVLQAFVIARPPTISAANNANVVLGTILPSAHDQRGAVRALGLPARCEQVIGATWYVTMGEDLGVACAEVLTLPRLQVFRFLMTDPAAALRALLKAVPLTQPALLEYIGSDASRAYGSLRSETSVEARSIGEIATALPVLVYIGVQLSVFVVLAISTAAWLIALVRRQLPAVTIVLTAALSGTAVYATVTSVFGDGMVELARHTHLGTVALYALVLLGILHLSRRFAARVIEGARAPLTSIAAPSLRFESAIVVFVALVVLTAPFWTPVWRAQPLAIGVVDEPASNRGISGNDIVLHGWAMHPLDPPSVVHQVPPHDTLTTTWPAARGSTAME